MNSDTAQPWRVLVERVGPQGKGRKFFCGAASESAANAIAADQNAREIEDAGRHARPDVAYRYTVAPRPDQP